MKADTKGYVELQTLYKHKARADLNLVSELLMKLTDRLGVDKTRISKEEIETFVKHSAFVKVVRGRSLRQEQESSVLRGRIGQRSRD